MLSKWWLNWLDATEQLADLHCDLNPKTSKVDALTVLVTIGHGKNEDMARAVLRRMDEQADEQPEVADRHHSALLIVDELRNTHERS